MKIKTRQRAETFIIAIAVILIIFIITIFKADNSINEKNIEYIASLGWQTEQTPCEILPFTVLEEFDAVFLRYNQITENVCELYKGQKVTRYSYKLLNDNNLRINLFLLKDQILWGDISSSLPNGFILPLKNVSDTVLP